MTSPAGGLESVRRARRALVVLTLINLFNYLDRWIVAALNERDRKSTRLNSSHSQISYAVFCLKKKKNKKNTSIAPTPTKITRSRRPASHESSRKPTVAAEKQKSTNAYRGPRTQLSA